MTSQSAAQPNIDKMAEGDGRDLLEGEGPLGDKLRAVTKRLGRTVKSVGERSLAVGKAVGGDIGVGGMPLGRVVG